MFLVIFEMDISIISKLPVGGAWWESNIPATLREGWEQCAYHDSSSTEFADATEVTDGTIGTKQQVIQQTSAEPRPKRRLLWDAILEKLDSCYGLYNGEQRKCAIRMIQEKFQGFVLSPTASQKFGPKKCRILNSWLSRNPMKAVDYDTIYEFLGFMLDMTDIRIVQERYGDWYLT